MKKSLLFIIIIFMMLLINNFYAAEVDGKEIVSTDVAINKKNFPDKIFREMVKNNFDSNKDGKLSDEEIDKVTKIKLNNHHKHSRCILFD